MKTMFDLITHIKKRPYFTHRIIQNDVLQFIHKNLPVFLQQHLYRLYRNNDILFFIFDDPVPKYEFNQKYKSIIYSLLKGYENRTNCSLGIKALKGETSYKHYQKNNDNENKLPIKPITNATFKELSLGNFKNTLQDSVLFNKLESIRTIINNNVIQSQQNNHQ